mgnify:CR=1 FL=1|jgi:hypothetical protein
MNHIIDYNGFSLQNGKYSFGRYCNWNGIDKLINIEDIYVLSDTKVKCNSDIKEISFNNINNNVVSHVTYNHSRLGLLHELIPIVK